MDGIQTNVRAVRGGEAVRMVVNARSTLLREATFAPQLADNTN